MALELPVISAPSERKSKVMLSYPPVSSVWHLPGGISQLSGVLQAEGHDVQQRYGHIEGLEYVLERQGGEEVRRALQIVRDTRSDIRALYEARQTFERVSKAIPAQKDAKKFSVERNNVHYVSRHYDGTVEGVMNAVQERSDHLWYDYFREVELKHAEDYKPDLYGISVADERQFIQACVLASMVKEALPETLVVMGGNFWSRVQGAFKHPQFERLFDLCDAIVYKEGFQPMQQLAATLDPSKASGTVYRDGKTVRINAGTSIPTDFAHLPAPNFPTHARQWAPDTVYPMYTMSNCPMQCGFCAISAGSDSYLEKPRAMSPKTIAEHMKHLGTHRFEIHDETFPIQRQLALGEELKRIGHEATWNCYLTMNDQLLDPELCKKLYEAGCRSVQLGLETLSPDTLKGEHKQWNHPDNYARILANLEQAGIQTHAFIITGIPGEPLHWGLKWMDFMEKHGDSILTIKSSRYRLTRGSPEERSGGHDALIEPIADNRPLHLNRDFRYRDSKLMSNKRVDAMRDLHEQMSREHWSYGVTSTLPWWANRGRFTWDELRAMAKELSTFAEEEEVPHFKLVLTKMQGIVRDELNQAVDLKSYGDAVSFARTLS